MSRCISFDYDHIRGVFESSQWRIGWNQAGLGSLLKALLGHFGHAEKLYSETHVACLLDIGDRYAVDPFDFHAREIDAGSKCDRGQEREFVTGVDSAYVERRIRFQVSQPARFRKDFVVRQPRTFHARQDIVACAVHHANDSADSVRGHALRQRLYDRDAARDRRLESKSQLLVFRRFRQVLAMHGEHGLVGGHNMLPGFQRRLYRSLGRAVFAADQFNEHIDVAPARKSHRIVLPVVAGNIDAAPL